MSQKEAQFIPKPTTADRLLAKSAKGVTFLLIGQVFTKFSTFVMNQILITYISAKVFGINAFLDFLMNTTLFFSREGIRLSSQRIHDIDEEADLTGERVDKYNHSKLVHGTRIAILQSIINIAYIPLLIGFPIATTVIYWQYGKISELFKNMELFNTALAVLWLAIILELLSEPFYILNQFNLNYDKRTKYESTAIAVSCFVNFGVIVWFKDEIEDESLPILAFTLGKLSHSLTLLVLYFHDFIGYKKSLHNGSRLRLVPTKIHKHLEDFYYFDHDALNHFYKMFFNLCFKHLLTEGDKVIITSLCTIEEQGIYSLISNYGSLLARLVFAPVEESLRNFLTRLLLDEASKDTKRKNLKLSIDILKKITSYYLYLSLIIGIFGPLNSGYLIKKIIGNNWSNHVSDTMPLYTLYLPLLAFNGVLEAVHQSTASGNEVVKYTWYMVGFSIVFFVTSYLGIDYFGLSLRGLILSNMINMVLRIIYCYGFIKHYYQMNSYSAEFKLFEFDANTISITKAAVGILVIDLVFFGVVSNLKELLGNVVLAGLFALFILYREKDLVISIIKRKPLA